MSVRINFCVNLWMFELAPWDLPPSLTRFVSLFFLLYFFVRVYSSQILKVTLTYSISGSNTPLRIIRHRRILCYLWWMLHYYLADCCRMLGYCMACITQLCCWIILSIIVSYTMLPDARLLHHTRLIMHAAGYCITLALCCITSGGLRRTAGC